MYRNCRRFQDQPISRHGQPFGKAKRVRATELMGIIAERLLSVQKQSLLALRLPLAHKTNQLACFVNDRYRTDAATGN